MLMYIVMTEQLMMGNMAEPATDSYCRSSRSLCNYSERSVRSPLSRRQKVSSCLVRDARPDLLQRRHLLAGVRSLAQVRAAADPHPLLRTPVVKVPAFEFHIDAHCQTPASFSTMHTSSASSLPGPPPLRLTVPFESARAHLLQHLFSSPSVPAEDSPSSAPSSAVSSSTFAASL